MSETSGSSGRLTLWGIEVFLATVEEGAITAAARRLGASASAVSQQLTNLEAALGVTLLDRSARPVRLTPEGTLFRLRAQAILTEAAQARAELRRAEAGRLAVLQLGMIEDFEADVTPRLLTELAARLDGTRILFETGPSHRLHDLLEAQGLDMIVAAEAGAAPDWAEVHPLMRDPFVAVVPPGTPEGLPDLPFLLYTTRHLMGRQIEGHLAAAGLRLPHRFEIGSSHALMALVAEGAGWTILSVLGATRGQRFLGAVELRPLPTQPLARDIALIARREGMGDWPAVTAGLLRAGIEAQVLGPARGRWPWLGDDLRLAQVP